VWFPYVVQNREIEVFTKEGEAGEGPAPRLIAIADGVLEERTGIVAWAESDGVDQATSKILGSLKITDAPRDQSQLFLVIAYRVTS
jgi:hypothetical protein